MSTLFASVRRCASQTLRRAISGGVAELLGLAWSVGRIVAR